MDSKLCFVIAPIGEADSEIRKRSDRILKFIIKPAIEAFGYEAKRADQISAPGQITSQVIQHILDSPLVIADLAGHNPNVFYELAIRHAVRKPLIQLSKKGESLPFDVTGMRTIFIDHQELESFEAVIAEMKAQITTLENGDKEIETPFPHALKLETLRHGENPMAVAPPPQPPQQCSFHYNNSTIELVFGDLFMQPGLRVIPVSEFMEEMDVIPTSLQAIVMKKIQNKFEGNQGTKRYQAELAKALEPKVYEVLERSYQRGREKKYPLGTSALIQDGDQPYLYIAVTKTEVQEFMGFDNCNVTQLWLALEKMWREARKESRGKDVNIPLIGSGVTGIKLEPKQVLEMILLSLFKTLAEDGRITTGVIRIVLYPPYFDRIDLREHLPLWRTAGGSLK